MQFLHLPGNGREVQNTWVDLIWVSPNQLFVRTHSGHILTTFQSALLSLATVRPTSSFCFSVCATTFYFWLGFIKTSVSALSSIQPYCLHSWKWKKLWLSSERWHVIMESWVRIHEKVKNFSMFRRLFARTFFLRCGWRHSREEIRLMSRSFK